jgi:hypothetical protein
MRSLRTLLAAAVCTALVAAAAPPAHATHVLVQASADLGGFSSPPMVAPPGTGSQFLGYTGTITGSFTVAPLTAFATLSCSFTGTDVGNAGLGVGQARGGCGGTSTTPPGWPVSINCDVTYQRAAAVTIWGGITCTVFVNGLTASGNLQGAFGFSTVPGSPPFDLNGFIQVSH